MGEKTGRTGITGLDRLRKQHEEGKKNFVKDVLEKNERFVEENSNARRQAAFDRYQIGLLEKENVQLTQRLNCSIPEDMEALIQHRVTEVLKRKLSHVGAVIRRTVTVLNSCMEQLNTIASDVDKKAEELERTEEKELKRISQFRGRSSKVEAEKRARKEALNLLPSVMESPLCRDNHDHDREGNLVAEEGGDHGYVDVENTLAVASDALREGLSSAVHALSTTPHDQEPHEEEDGDLDLLSTTITVRAKTSSRRTTKTRSPPKSPSSPSECGQRQVTKGGGRSCQRSTTPTKSRHPRRSPKESVDKEDATTEVRSSPGGSTSATPDIPEDIHSIDQEDLRKSEITRPRSATPAEADGNGRRKRAAATKIRSFKEPSLITKMRRLE